MIENVSACARELCDAVEIDFPKSGIEVVFDVINNLICFQKMKRKQTDSKDVLSSGEFFHPLDRTHVQLTRKYTSQRVESALKMYLGACNAMKQEVSRLLAKLCLDLVTPSSGSGSTQVGAIVQSAQATVILNTALYHAYSSKQQGWELPVLDDPTDGQSSRLHLDLKGLTPYWLDRSTAVSNDVDIQGMILLTAPNMSGKSTIMRSTLVACLLANCGLCIPARSSSIVPRYDCYFLRTSSYDVPAEGKSAFGLEMDDMRVVLRDSSSASLVMIDEIGKGTSSRDGAAVAGALLEHLDKKNVSGIFATHLHELFSLPLNVTKLYNRRMGVDVAEGPDSSRIHRWTYRLEEGICTNSMAIITARAFGLPEDLVQRAKSLGNIFDRTVQNRSSEKYISRNNAPRNAIDIFESFINSCKDRVAADDENAFEQLYRVTAIPHDAATPAYLEGHSCVYILQIKMLKDEQVYVGETDSMANRLRTHRR